MIVDGIFTSIWNNYGRINTQCRVDLTTCKVTYIEIPNIYIENDSLIEEYITIDRIKYKYEDGYISGY